MTSLTIIGYSVIASIQFFESRLWGSVLNLCFAPKWVAQTHIGWKLSELATQD